MDASDARSPTGGRRVALGGALFLMALVLVPYAQVVHHEFVRYDDPEYIFENTIVQRGLTPDGIVWAFTEFHASNWHPLTWVSHMIDVELFGLDSGGHHAVSVAFHALGAILLFLALRAMTGTPWPSLLVAALFAAHPLRVESVAWAAERKDVLSGVFWMLALLAYAAYVRRPEPARYLAVTAAIAAGLMAKPMLVTLPFVFLLLDYWPCGRMFARDGLEDDPPRARGLSWLVLEKLPWMALSGGVAAMTIAAQRGAMSSVGAIPLDVRLANAVVGYLAYLGKTVWPAGLAVYYPHPTLIGEAESLVPRALVSLGVLLLISILALRLARSRPHLIVGWLWYLGTLVPVVGFVQVGTQAMADRYTYLPTVGIYIALAWELRALALATGRTRTVGALALVTVVALASATSAQVRHWKDGRTLFEHAIAVTERNHVAHNNLGSFYEARGDNAAARKHYEEAIRIRPEHARAHDNLGNVLTNLGETARARFHYDEALRLDPDNAKAHNNLGILLARQGQTDQARQHYERALAIRPDYPNAHNNLGNLLARAENNEAAQEHYEAALLGDPGYAKAHNNLASVLLAKGDLDLAFEHYETALRLDPDYISPHVGLGRIYERRAELRRAAEHYELALDGDAPPIDAALRLAWIRATSPEPDLRDGASAVRWARFCAERERDALPVLETLAAAYAEIGRFDEAASLQARVVERTTGGRRIIAQRRLSAYRAGRPHRSAG